MGRNSKSQKRKYKSKKKNKKTLKLQAKRKYNYPSRKKYSRKKNKKKTKGKRIKKNKTKKIYLLPIQKGGTVTGVSDGTLTMQQEAENERQLKEKTEAIVRDIKTNLANLTGRSEEVGEDEGISSLTKELLDKSFQDYIKQLDYEDVASKIDTQVLLSGAQGEETDKISEEKNRLQLEIMKGLMDKNKKLIEKLLQKTNQSKLENSEIIKDLRKLIKLSEKQKDEIQELRKLEPKLEKIMESNKQLKIAQSAIPTKLKDMQKELVRLSGLNEQLESDNQYSEENLEKVKRKMTNILSKLSGFLDIHEIENTEDIDKAVLDQIEDKISSVPSPIHISEDTVPSTLELDEQERDRLKTGEGDAVGASVAEAAASVEVATGAT
jgi:hypothetical protein